MTSALALLICCILSLNRALKTCFDRSHELNYLFLLDGSQLQIPLLPLDCHLCAHAEHVDIQLIEEQPSGNRTVQRLKIFLRNFEIEDSTYICLISSCPIHVQYGSDSMLLNVTSTALAHRFLSMTYFQPALLCTLETRFAIVSPRSSLTCTERIYIHPRRDSLIAGQVQVNDCRANQFEHLVYQSSLRFHRVHLPMKQHQVNLRASDQPCQYFVENIYFLDHRSVWKQVDHLLTTVAILPLFNPWKEEMIVLGPCRTELVPFKEMFFTDDIIHVRNLHVEPGRTIEIRCPIDGSEVYIKYVWYYQRYQSKYQISSNRTILLSNITEKVQGKYMCIGDDGNEKLEFEMNLQVRDRSTHSFPSHFIIITCISIGVVLILCVGLSFIICYLWKVYARPVPPSKPPALRSSINSQSHKSPSLTVHHDVQVTIRHAFSPQTKHYVSSETLTYIDDSPWSRLEQSFSALRPSPISCRYSTSHLDTIGHYRNINGQPIALNLPFIRSQSDTTLSRRAREIPDEIRMLKISVPSLNAYPFIKPVVSFDSERELDEFNQMSLLSIDRQSPSTNNMDDECKQNT